MDALTFELPNDEYRKRVRIALLKDKTNLKKLREKNIDEDADVSDIDHKLKLLDGDKNGTPGLIQLFSTQTEIFAEREAGKKSNPDKDQITIEDAIAEASYREVEGEWRWNDQVPEPRPKAGDRVRSLDRPGEIDIITKPIGFELVSYDAERGDSVEDADRTPVFFVLVVPVSKTDGYTEEDQRKVFLHPESVRNDEAEWSEIPAPPVDVDAIRQAALVGEAAEGEADETPTRKAIETDTDSPNVSKGNGNGKPGRKPRRKSAGAGNLAGAVSRVAKTAGSGRKRSGKK